MDFGGDAAMRLSEASFTQGYCPCPLTNRTKGTHKIEQHRESLSIPGFTQGYCPCLLTNRTKGAHKSEQHRESLPIPGDADD